MNPFEVLAPIFKGRYQYLPPVSYDRNKREAWLAGVAVMALLAGVEHIHAETFTWKGTASGAWGVSTNWDPTGVSSTGDQVVIGTTRAVVGDARTTGDIELTGRGGLTIDQSGTLTFDTIDLISPEGSADALANNGQVTGDVGKNESGLRNFGTWNGDVGDNSNTLFNHNSWNGAILLNSGTLFSQPEDGGEDRPQWVGDVRVNDGTLIQNSSDWFGNVEFNSYYIESKIGSTWTGDVWDNEGSIINSDTSVWNGDILGNSGYIDNSDLEGTWNGDILANTGDIFNGGLWEGDVVANDGYVSNFYSESIWKGDILSNAGTISSVGIWNGSLTSSGTLALENQVNGAIDNSGILQLSGDLSGVTTLTNSGTLAMTHQSGAQAISAGSVSFGTDSKLLIDIDASASDRIAVDGVASLGGIVEVTAASGVYDASLTYTILTAASLDGRFEGVTTDLAFFAARLGYDEAGVNLRLLRNDQGFASIGTTSNQMGVGATIEAFGAGNSLFDEVLWLSTEDIGPALASLAGEIHASAQNTMLDAGEVVTSNLQRRAALRASFATGGETVEPQNYAAGIMPVASTSQAMIAAGVVPTADLPGYASDRVMTAWSSLLGKSGKIGSNGNASEFDSDLSGISGGIDGSWSVMNGTLVAGLAGAYTRTDADIRATASSVDLDTGHVGFYGAWDAGALRLSGSAAYAFHEIDSQRRVSFGNIDETAEADYVGHTFGVSTEAVYRFALGGLKIGPVATLDALAGRHEAATETGAEALDLRIGAASEQRIDGGIGLLAATEWTSRTIRFSAEARFIYKHAFGDRTPSQGLAFASAPDDGFTVLGPDRASDWLTVGGHVQAVLSDSVSVGLDYEGSFASTGDTHQGNVTFNYRF